MAFERFETRSSPASSANQAHRVIEITISPFTDARDRSVLVFLADSATELATKAPWTKNSECIALRQEAEELMLIRARLLNRHWELAKASQFELPLALKQAA